MQPDRQSNRWAPWWLYVLVIAPANMGKQQLLPAGASWWLVAGTTAVTILAGLAAVTAVYRASQGDAALGERSR